MLESMLSALVAAPVVLSLAAFVRHRGYGPIRAWQEGRLLRRSWVHCKTRTVGAEYNWLMQEASQDLPVPTSACVKVG